MTAKPLFRWILGKPSELGFRVLQESLKQTTSALGYDKFDWMVCYNNLSKDQLDRLSKIVYGTSVTLFQQSETCIPIPEKRIETLWKLCPPRLRMESHEIIVDNDVVICRGMPEIDEFLCSVNKVICLDEALRYLGRYDSFFEPKKTYNSGLIGLYPNYDFAGELYKFWKKHGKIQNFDAGDEQGLIGATLRSEKQIIVSRNRIQKLNPKNNRPAVDWDIVAHYTSEVAGYHFVVANRTDIGMHSGWEYYKNLKLKSMKIL